MPSPSPELPGFQAVHGTTLRYSGIRQPSGYDSGQRSPSAATPIQAKQLARNGLPSTRQRRSVLRHLPVEASIVTRGPCWLCVNQQVFVAA